MLKSHRLLLLFVLMPSLGLLAQTAAWWEQNVHWDGVTHWSRYLTISPGYLGPNALTIPSINNGSVDSIISLGASLNAHFSKGDQTQNLTLYGNYTTKDKAISVDAQFVPYEHYNMSHAIKTKRKVFFENYYDDASAGDVLVNTTIQLFPKKRSKFQAALRVGVRMPSGGGLGAARYGDVPGYWIDAGAGVPFRNANWKWIGMLGFYVWQTNDDHHRQDDAILFGTGLEFNRKRWRCLAYMAGYSGYKNNGDRPVVVRLAVEKNIKRYVLMMRLQQGLHDYAYTSSELGVKFRLGK